MSRIIMITTLILLGLFAVYVINNNVTPKPAVVQDSGLNLGALSPTLSETNSNKAIIKTSKGDIELTLYSKDAPNTVNNFVQKAKIGFYNSLIFHRVEDWVIQGGDPMSNGTGGGKMATELNNKPFVIGSLGIARGQDINISNDSQFFITKQNASWLNGQYTNFGIVTKGMDIVEKIEIGDKILGITLQ